MGANGANRRGKILKFLGCWHNLVLPGRLKAVWQDLFVRHKMAVKLICGADFLSAKAGSLLLLSAKADSLPVLSVISLLRPLLQLSSVGQILDRRFLSRCPETGFMRPLQKLRFVYCGLYCNCQVLARSWTEDSFLGVQKLGL